MLPTKKTKIVCTIGPASRNPETLESLILAGMNVARINFAHGDLASHAQTVAAIRDAARTPGFRRDHGRFAGPKLRIGMLETSHTARDDAPFVLQARRSSAMPRAPRPPSRPATGGETRRRVFLNDGFIELVVEASPATRCTAASRSAASCGRARA